MEQNHQKEGNQTNSVGLISMANITHFPLKFKMHFQSVEKYFKDEWTKGWKNDAKFSAKLFSMDILVLWRRRPVLIKWRV